MTANDLRIALNKAAPEAREIGSVLRCSEGTARNILFRSLRKMRTSLDGFREVQA